MAVRVPVSTKLVQPPQNQKPAVVPRPNRAAEAQMLMRQMMQFYGGR